MNLIRLRRWCSFLRGTRCTTTCPPGPGSCRQGRPCTMSRLPSWGSSCPRRMVSATWRPFLRRTGRPRHCSTTICQRPAGTFPLGRGCILSPRHRRTGRCHPLRFRRAGSSCPRRTVSATWRPLLGRTSRPQHCSTTTCPHPAGTFPLGRGCSQSPRRSSVSTAPRRSSCSDSSCPCPWCTGPPTPGCTMTCPCWTGRCLLGMRSGRLLRLCSRSGPRLRTGRSNSQFRSRTFRNCIGSGLSPPMCRRCGRRMRRRMIRC